jgi:hypothetical protein
VVAGRGEHVNFFVEIASEESTFDVELVNGKVMVDCMGD